MPNASKLIIMGLQASGKTSYLAALWHYLEGGEVVGRLSAPELQPDREYLNSIRKKWLSAEVVGRTSQRATYAVRLPVKDSVTGRTVDIDLPDLSGEAFFEQWEKRKATRAYAEFAAECDGALLLVHSQSIQRTKLIAAGTAPASKPAEPFVPWTPKLSSTQVQLVDLIQSLMYLRDRDERMRLAVGISAWDLVSEGVRPTEWLDRRLPLLGQFLRSNEDRFASAVFGISALGGDLEKDRERLLNVQRAADRPKVTEGNGAPAAIATPIEFLLNVDG